MDKLFACHPKARVVLEADTYSRWVSFAAEAHCAEVFVANPRKLSVIYKNDRKSDEVDAEALARVGRMDPKLLSPVRRRPRGPAPAVLRPNQHDDRRGHGTDEGRLKPVLVDANVLLDFVTDDPTWGSWSAGSLRRLAEASPLLLNPLIYAEISVGFARIEDLERALPHDLYRSVSLPYEAAFLAGKCFDGTDQPACPRNARAFAGRHHPWTGAGSYPRRRPSWMK